MKRQYLSKLHRLLIYKSTDGRCGICGDPVDFDCFEVDHIIPFTTTGRTLLPELQPAHPRCNRMKGSRIMTQFTTFASDPKRPRIAEAVATIQRRIATGHQTTSLVIPPRYGKSNIIRLSAIEFVETGLVQSAVVLSPWIALRGQMIDVDRIKEMAKRMMPAAVISQPITMSKLSSDNINPTFHLEKPRRHLWSMTIGGASSNQNRVVLADAARHCKQVIGRPLLVFIDEGHLVAGGDGWGKLALELEQAGAHVVLLTGTPERADNIAPYGFRMTEIDRKGGVEAKVLVNRRVDQQGRRWADVQSRTFDKVEYRLEADLPVSLKEAWNDKILARLQVRWFSCQVDREDLSAVTGEQNVRRGIAQAIRDDDVKQKAIDLFIEDIAARRQSRPRSAGIVFVGNDRPDDESKDHEARLVRARIEKAWRDQFGTSGTVEIATMDAKGDGKVANGIIRAFADKDIGDVLIVKQMGGVGLDVPRLKTALDLSTIRTRANTTQRWLRIATALDGVAHGTLILPDDEITTTLFDDIVTKQGGEFTVNENISVTGTDTIELMEGDEEDAPVISNAHAAGASDQDGSDIEEEQMPDIARAIADYPAIADRFTLPEIEQLIRDGAYPPRTRAPASTATTGIHIEDIDSEQETLRSEINDLVSRCTQKTYPYSGTGNGATEYAEHRRKIMSDAKKAAGINSKLAACHDPVKLQGAKDYLKRRLSGV